MRDRKAFEQYLEDLFNKRGYAGMGVVIRGPEGILVEKYMGMRDMAGKKAVDDKTVFGIASMSKSMTALALCILTAEGKMSLDDPVSKYFPNFKVPGNPKSAVTVKNLAMHNAGIPPMEPLEWSIACNCEREGKWIDDMRKASPNKMDKIEHIIDYIAEGRYPTLGGPGEVFSYSNEGYAIMSYIVDKVAGIPLEQFLDERVFGPLGMTRSVLDPYTSRAEKLGDLTLLHEFDEDGNITEDGKWSTCPPFRGCACVKSTPLDMTRYYKMLCDGGLWEGRQVVPAEAVRMMAGPMFPLEKERHYCMGLNKSEMNGLTVCEHSGGLHGVSTEGGYVEGGYSFAVLTNHGSLDLDEFRWACCNYIMGLEYDTDHYWCEPNGEEFSDPEMLTGDFTSHEGSIDHTIVEVKDGKLVCNYSGIENCELKWCGKLNFAVYRPGRDKRISTFTFFMRDGHAWGVRCGSRVCQIGG